MTKTQVWKCIFLMLLLILCSCSSPFVALWMPALSCASPGRELLYFQGMGSQCYKLVFLEMESISFWSLAAQMAVVLVHFKEKKYEIYESSDTAFMKQYQRKSMFSVEKEQAHISKIASLQTIVVCFTLATHDLWHNIAAFLAELVQVFSHHT